jgi:hypothetical protein
VNKPTTVTIGSYEVHPFRRFVPEKPHDEYLDLVEFIRKFGQPYPIVRDVEGRILDGRANLRAVLELGLSPIFREPPISEGFAALVLASMKGTSYGTAAIALAAARLYDEIETESKKFTGRVADAAGSAAGGSNAPYVYDAREYLERKDAAEVIAAVDMGEVKRFSHVRALMSLDDAARAKALQRIRGGTDPAVVLRDAGQRNGDEWYTPPDVVAAITWAFDGEIMCDPCSPISGDSPVVAKHRYTIDDDGLSKSWCDRTYVNPPYSATRPWIKKAIEESSEGKRIYMLLPVRPSSSYQLALINASIDVLLLKKRLSFFSKMPDDEEVEPKGKGTGRNALMIVGLHCSTTPLVEMGLEGQIIKRDQVHDLSIPEDDKKPWILTPRPYDDQPPRDEWGPPLELRPSDLAEAEAQIARERDHDEAMLVKGRAAVAAARAKMAEDAAAKKAARKKRTQLRKMNSTSSRA